MEGVDSDKQKILEDTYEESIKSIGNCYDANELLLLFKFYVSALIWLETGITKESLPDSNDDNQSQAIQKMWRNILEIASSLSISNKDFEYFKKISIWLSKKGFDNMSALIEVFLLTLDKFIEAPPPDSHSHFDITSLECKNCNHNSEYLIWNIVNTRLREDLQQQVSSGEIFKHRCPYCGHISMGIGILFYCDSCRDDYLLLIPSYEEDIIKDAQDGTSKYLESIPKEFRGDKSHILFASRYFPGPWQNAESFNIVSCLHNIDELQEIINAALMSDCLVFSNETMRNPIYIDADYEFRAKNYEKAITLYIEGFLKDQKQTPWLYNICAALCNLGKDDVAVFLKSRTDALKLKLKGSGVMYDFKVNWTSSQTPEGFKLSCQIDKEGLPTDWNFEDIILTLKELSAELGKT